jgi:hypothetical protein
MQMSSATKDSDQPALNWRQRKKLVARRQQEIERRQRMIADYVGRLGGDVSEIQRRNVERVVDLELLAAMARAAALRGEESLGNVTRLEIQASKAVRMLGLPAVPGAEPDRRAGRGRPGPMLADFIASHEEGE